MSKREVGIGNRGLSPRQPLQILKDIGRVGASTALVEDRALHRGRVPTSKTRIHTTMHSWYTTLAYNINYQINNIIPLPSTVLISLPIEAQGILQADTISQIQQKQGERLLNANEHRTPSRTPRQRLGVRADDIVLFEYININGINSHDSFIELSNTMGILEQMELGVYIIVET